MSCSRNTQLLLLLAAVASAACAKVPLTAPAGSTIFAQVNPPFVIANGGTSVVTALVTEPAGTLVPNGTEVFFFTSLGRIDERVQTRDGIAHANFVADARSGTASITIYSGGPAPAAPAASASPGTGGGTTTPAASTATGTGSATVSIAIGSALPARVVVGADPQRITSPRRATIVANVFDNVGNPVQNVPVVFSITSTGTIEETLASGGSPLYSDSNGQAFDTLVTRAAAGSAQKAVTVTATAANGILGTVTVFID